MTGKRMTPARRWVLIPAAIFGLLLMASFWEHASFVGVTLRTAPFLGFSLAFGSIGGVWAWMRRRVGLEARCPRCGYQRAPTGPHPPRCPECGFVWSDRNVIRGRPAQPLWIALSASGAMAVLLFFVLLSSVWDSSPLALALMRIEPTGALIVDVTAGEFGFDHREWRELLRRRLSQTQRERLATGLLDRRLRHAALGREASTWFRNQVLAKRLPAPIVQRYYRERFTLEIVPPAAVHAGQKATLTIRGHRAYHGGQPVSISTAFIFEAVYVDDQIVAADYKKGMMQYAGLLAHPRYEIHADWTAADAGVHSIRVVGWFVVGPNLRFEREVEWDPNHRPTLPATTEWAERIEAAAKVHVQP